MVIDSCTDYTEPTTRILVVDDEPLVCEAIQDRLHSIGYEPVECVNDIRDVLKAVRSFSPTIVLMDLRFDDDTNGDDMKGIEAARAIQLLHDIPVVYHTAHSEVDVFQRVRDQTETEIFGYLSKTAADDELKVAIEMSTHNHRLQWQGASEAIYAVDTHRTIRSLNAKTATVIGCRASDVIGTKFENLLPRNYYREAASSFRKNTASRESKTYEIVVRSRDDTVERALRFKAQPVWMINKLVGIRIVAQVITELKKDEAKKLKNYNLFFGDTTKCKKVGKYLGEVEEITQIDDLDVVKIRFCGGNGEIVSLFPRERLAKVKASFPSAKIEYEMFQVGAANVSKLSYNGPPREKLLAQELASLSDEDLEAFKDLEALDD